MDNRPPTLMPSTSTPASSTDRGLVNATIDLVQRLVAIFPRLNDADVDRKEMVRQWAQGLADMRPMEIERGLAACRGRKFAPSLGEFAQLCRPALDPEIAFYEAERGLAARSRGEVGVWSHPAIWRAACELSSLVREGNYAACRRRWEFLLAGELAKGWGEDVPQPVLQIENSADLVFTAMPGHTRKALAGLRNRFQGVRT